MKKYPQLDRSYTLSRHSRPPQHPNNTAVPPTRELQTRDEPTANGAEKPSLSPQPSRLISDLSRSKSPARHKDHHMPQSQALTNSITQSLPHRYRQAPSWVQGRASARQSQTKHPPPQTLHSNDREKKRLLYRRRTVSMVRVAASAPMPARCTCVEARATSASTEP